ncbi:hypothetical protein STENM327S_03471 [Streptomyces tendae]
MLTTRFVTGAPNSARRRHLRPRRRRILLRWPLRLAVPLGGAGGREATASSSWTAGSWPAAWARRRSRARRPGRCTSRRRTPGPPPRPPSRRTASVLVQTQTSWTRARWRSSPTGPGCRSASGSRGGAAGWTWPARRARCARWSCTRRTSRPPPRTTVRCSAWRPPPSPASAAPTLRQSGRGGRGGDVRRHGPARRGPRRTRTPDGCRHLRGRRRGHRGRPDRGAGRDGADARDGDIEGVGRVAHLADPYARPLRGTQAGTTPGVGPGARPALTPRRGPTPRPAPAPPAPRHAATRPTGPTTGRRRAPGHAQTPGTRADARHRGPHRHARPHSRPERPRDGTGRHGTPG